ncbi:MAG: AAA family ATPase [Lachnospiraceae bacterium]|nr:AAA family ATPase [Lachnospiraceae bacterium]
MKISSLQIKNFKSIRNVVVDEVDNTFILVGKNSTGKSSVVDAIRVILGDLRVDREFFNNPDEDMIISINCEINQENMELMNNLGIISKERNYDKWEKEFFDVFPTFKDGFIKIVFRATIDGKYVYEDEEGNENNRLKEILPKLYYIDHRRNLTEFQESLLDLKANDQLTAIKEDACLNDRMKACNQCYKCINDIMKKSPEELSILETARLMQYKFFKLNIDNFAENVNKCLEKNGMRGQTVEYSVKINPHSLYKIQTNLYKDGKNTGKGLMSLGAGGKSIYMLSLLEAYIEEKSNVHSLIMIEDPEICLHPQLQKVASEILYRLSKKNQVIFSTYSPNMIFNFSSKQIKQVVLDEDGWTDIVENTDIDDILDDLGYTANDLMNVSFVFIVEGKQDRNRLPLLLEKYYSEMRDEDGKLSRISIIQTNSCTNIKTYANLKYINQLYLKDQFLMIRDSDGKNPKYLVKQLCNYYSARAKEDVGNLPNVQPKNVLVLKYYSFENYFLDPKIMAKIGVIKDEDEFYTTLFKKYKDYLYKITSFKRLIRTQNIRINSKEDIKNNMEAIKIYVRGHNLFDIFYGKYRNDEQEIIKKYIEAAPRETFKDILDTIDSFVYFENRKRV